MQVFLYCYYSCAEAGCSIPSIMIFSFFGGIYNADPKNDLENLCCSICEKRLHHHNSLLPDCNRYHLYCSLPRARNGSYHSCPANGAVFCSNHHHTVRTFSFYSALKMSQNSQNVEHLLYLTLPSAMYKLRLCLGITKSTSRITRH